MPGLDAGEPEWIADETRARGQTAAESLEAAAVLEQHCARPSRALRARVSLRSLEALQTGVSLRSLEALRPGISLRSWSTRGSGVSRVPLVSFRPPSPAPTRVAAVH